MTVRGPQQQIGEKGHKLRKRNGSQKEAWGVGIQDGRVAEVLTER